MPQVDSYGQPYRKCSLSQSRWTESSRFATKSSQLTQDTKYFEIPYKIVQPLWKTIWVLKSFKLELPHDSVIPLLGMQRPTGTESICPHKNLCGNVHGSFLHKSQKVESTQMSTKSRMDKQNVVYPSMEYYLVTKRNEVLTQALWINLETLC